MTIALSPRVLDFQARLSLARQRGSTIGGPSALLAEWKSLGPFQGDDAFQGRLNSLGIAEDELDAALALTDGDLGPRERDLFAPTGLHLLTDQADSSVADKDPTRAGADDLDRSMLVLVAPLIETNITALSDHLARLAGQAPALFRQSRQLLDQAREQLGKELFRLLLRSCTLELNVARLRGTIRGETPQDRYRDFICTLSSAEGRKTFFDEYQALWRLLNVRAGFWLDNARQLFSRLAADSEAIERALGTPISDTPLLDVNRDQGDSHCGGRSVALLRFENGNRLVYKPHSVAAESGFHSLIQWFNAHHDGPGLRAVRALDRGDYGWCEFIEQLPLSAAGEAARFYHRQGEFIALFHLLSTSDLHHENLIAHGAHPVYVDLETIFHAGAHYDVTLDGSADTRIPHCVSDTMLLPGSGVGNGQHMADLSALGATQEIDWPFEIETPVAIGTDELRIERRSQRIAAASHLPAFNGTRFAAHEHLDSLKAGFNTAYRTLLRERAFLDGPEGLDRFFGKALLRQVIRPTVLYGTLLNATLHPDYQRDWLERRIQFERLWPAHGPAWQKQLFDVELADLEQQDVPYFARAYDSRDLLDSRGSLFSGVFSSSPRELAHAQLQRLSGADRLAQLRIIDACFGVTDPLSLPPSCRAMADEEAAPTTLECHARAEAARLIDSLLASAIEHDRNLYWHCQATDSNNKPLLKPELLSFYDGQLGIAFALAASVAITGDAAHERSARKALDTALRWCGTDLSRLRSIGAFGGALAVPYLLTNIGVLWNERSLIAKAFSFLEGRSPEAPDHQFDIIGGSAGAILVAAGLLPHAGTRNEHRRILALIERYTGQLLAGASRMPQGLGWRSLGDTEPAVTGFSHGGAGITVALATAARVLDRADLAQPIADALSYENAQFDHAAGNWLDLRKAHRHHHDENGTAACSTSWCHGAPGIALGRALLLGELHHSDNDALRSAPDTLQPVLLRDLTQAVKTTVARGLTGGHSLCHGSLGNWQVLRDTGVRHGLLGGQTLSDLLHQPFELARTSGWQAGDALAVSGPALAYAPGLMTGMAGIAYALLDIAVPDTLPQLLRLEVASPGH